MTTPQLTSLLVRLQNESARKVNDTLQELLEFPDALDKVVQIVETRIDVGTYFVNGLLACLISLTNSKTLYNRVREQLLKDHWAALKLYEYRYPDLEIEKNLCRRLYQIASDDADPLRRAIVDAMRDFGSEAALPTLEAILFDLEPSARIRAVFSDALLGPLEILEARSRAEFVKHVTLAVNDIKSRVAVTAETVVSGTREDETPEQVDETNNARRARVQAQRYIDAGDPEVAIIFIRRGAEALAKDLYCRLGYEQKRKPAKKMMLEELLKPLRDSDIAEVFKHLIQTFQIFGNFAAHDQGGQSIYLTREIASALLVLYDQALSIYSVWRCPNQ